MMDARKQATLLTTAAVVLLPLVLTSVLMTVRLMTGNGSPFWDILCLLLTVLVWGGAAVLTRLSLPGVRLAPWTGLALSGILLCSVLLYTVAFAMEESVITLQPVLWVISRLCGGPAAVSDSGMGILAGSAEPGASAMLSCGLYLGIALIAAFPRRQKTLRKK